MPQSLRHTRDVKTIAYATGRRADLIGDPARPPVLLWHGKQASARAVVRPLAELVAGHGLAVVVPDWDARADDGGRADLLQSVRFARDWADDPDRMVLVGWSMGGLAAADLTIHAAQFGTRFAHTVCLAGAFMFPGPFSGKQPATELSRNEHRTPFTLLHGTADDAVPAAASRQFAATLEQNDWPVQLIELAADHGNIAGASHDPVADRYAASENPDTLVVATAVAARIATAAGC